MASGIAHVAYSMRTSPTWAPDNNRWHYATYTNTAYNQSINCRVVSVSISIFSTFQIRFVSFAFSGSTGLGRRFDYVISRVGYDVYSKSYVGIKGLNLLHSWIATIKINSCKKSNELKKFGTGNVHSNRFGDFNYGNANQNETIASFEYCKWSTQIADHRCLRAMSAATLEWKQQAISRHRIKSIIFNA